MPETAHHMNGYANGHTPPELQQDTSFLFTSESVGEGHPGRSLKKRGFVSWLARISLRSRVTRYQSFHVAAVNRVCRHETRRTSHTHIYPRAHAAVLPFLRAFLTFLKSSEMRGYGVTLLYRCEQRAFPRRETPMPEQKFSFHAPTGTYDLAWLGEHVLFFELITKQKPNTSGVAMCSMLQFMLHNFFRILPSTISLYLLRF